MSDSSLLRARSGVGGASSPRRNNSGAAQTGPEIVLTASEVGCYAFCPAAWHNQRVGAIRNSRGMLNLERGALTHRRIGTSVTRIRWLERMRFVTLLLLIALIAGVAEMMAGGSILQP
jgi:hypothetical protein